MKLVHAPVDAVGELVEDAALAGADEAAADGVALKPVAALLPKSQPPVGDLLVVESLDDAVHPLTPAADGADVLRLRRAEAAKEFAATQGLEGLIIFAGSGKRRLAAVAAPGLRNDLRYRQGPRTGGFVGGYKTILLVELRVRREPGLVLAALRASGVAGEDAFAVGSTLTVPLHDGTAGEAIAAIDRLALAEAISTRRPTLDDVYLRLTGGRLAEGPDLAPMEIR